MRQGFRRPSPALIVAVIALFAALGGTVFAAGRISGRAIKVKSLPGNRLKLHSVPANRLKPGAIHAESRFAVQISGAEIDELSLGQVPEAAHAEVAESAQHAFEAETAQNAIHAVDASTVNGHGAGCLPGTQPFAGACWQSSASETALDAPHAAAACADRGGALPEALQLAAFALEPGVVLDAGSEWSSDVTNVSGKNLYGVVTVSAAGAVNVDVSTEARKYHCVIPLVT